MPPELEDGAAAAAAEDTSAADLAAAEDTTTDAAAQPGEGDAGDDAAAAAGGQGDTTPPKKTAQDRIDELTRARREAERERDYFRGLAEGRAPKQEQPARQQAEEDAEPDPADFTYSETDPAYIKALTAHTVRQEHARISNETRRRDAVQTVETTWTERQQAFAKDKPDFFEKTNDERLPITPVMADAIKTSEDGAAVAYHLATNPDEARRISGLSQIAQVREIGKLEARLTKPAAETPPKTLTDAPAPNPNLRGAGGKFKVSPDTDDFAAFERQYGG